MISRKALRECALVAAVAAFQLLGTWGASHGQQHMRHLDILSTLLLLLGPLSLPLRRKSPWLPVGISLIASITYFSVGYPGGPAFASLIVALVVARRERFRQSREARMQAEAQRRSEERLAIARELHDVLAHSTSVVAVQAGVALHLLDTHPDQARASLEAIREASAESMRELRAALEILRGDEGERAGRNPQPGLAERTKLLESATAAGLSVDLRITGEERPLSAEVDLAAFRILQEALTNAARHADLPAVGVRLDYGDSWLTIQVSSTGRRTGNAPGSGSGLVGMRERAVSLGGSVTTDDSSGQFVVDAFLPYATASTAGRR